MTSPKRSYIGSAIHIECQGCQRPLYLRQNFFLVTPQRREGTFCTEPVNSQEAPRAIIDQAGEYCNRECRNGHSKGIVTLAQAACKNFGWPELLGNNFTPLGIG